VIRGRVSLKSSPEAAGEIKAHKFRDWVSFSNLVSHSFLDVRRVILTEYQRCHRTLFVFEFDGDNLFRARLLDGMNLEYEFVASCEYQLN
jgi:hypothetical protein